MAGEVTSVTVTEQTLYNLTITEDDAKVVTVTVPDSIATIEVSHYDVSVTMSNVGAGEGVFKSKSVDNFLLKSIKDDDKTIDITSNTNNDQIDVKLPDAGISTPDGFTINADSDNSAKIELPGPTVDLSKAKLLTDLDVNSKDLDSVATITAVTGDITTVNSTTVNATTGTITTLGSTTGNITTVNSTNVNSTNLDVDTGTIDELTVVNATATDSFIGDLRGAVKFRAKAGEDLSKGEAVYISGISGNTPVVSLAKADSATTMPAYGLVFADANNNANVQIIEFGDLKGLDTATDSLELDKPVYVSATTAGGITATRPTGATHLVQNIGLVNRVHQSAGAIKVGGSGRVNDVPNTFSITGDITTTAGTITAPTVNFDGGSIDGTTIGASVSSTGVFSTLESASVDINGGAIDGTTIGSSNPSTIVTTDLTATTADINAGTIDNTVIGATTPAAVTTSSLVATTADINGGTIDNSVIGATTPVAGTFTTVGVTTVNATDVNVSDDLDVTDDASIGGDLAVTGNTVLTGNLTVNGTQTIVNTETLTVDDNIIVLNNNEAGTPSQNGGIEIERGTSDNAVFQWTEATDKWEAKVGSSYAALKVEDVNTNTLTATTGNITNMNSSNVDITGGSIDNVSITNIGAIDGTTIGATTSSTGRFTTMQSDSVDINGGTIDGVAIAGATSLGTSGNLTVTGTTGLTGLLTAANVEITGTLEGPTGGFHNHIKPSADSTYDCGINTTRWRNGYFDNVTITNNFILDAGMSTFTLQNGADILVTTEGGSDLGSTDRAFNALWVDEIHPSEANGGTNTIEFHGGFQPDTDGVFDIGMRTLKWDKVYSNTTVTSVLDSVNTGATETIELQADLLPDGHKTRDLGSPTKAFHSVYVGDGSLYVDGAKVLGSSDGSAINMTTDAGQDLYLSAGGPSGTSGELVLSSRENKTTIDDTTVNLGGTSGNSATINAYGPVVSTSTVTASDFSGGGFAINNDAITNADGGITLTTTQTNGAGYIHLNTPDVYVGPFNGALKLDESSISVTNANGDLNLVSNGTGAVTIDELTFSQFSAGGENGNKIAADENRVLMLNASGGAGYIYSVAPSFWLGDGSSGAYFQSNSGAASTLKPWGQDLAIGPHPSGNFNVTFEGDLTGDVTGNLDGKAIANPQNITVPGVTNTGWGGFNLLNQGAMIGSVTHANSGYPIVGYTQTTNSNQSQPQAQYLVNYMDYDISGGLAGAGVSVSFAAQDESGKLLDIASNLCKLRGPSTSGSSGSSTVDSWEGEYTLSVTGNAGSGANNVTTNVITTNTEFTEVSTELRVVDKPGNSGNTALSGLYLTYDGAQTGTPSGKIKLKDEDGNSTTNLMTLEEDRVSQQVVHKQHTASSDPSGENGDMYYNTTSHKFRGYANGAWTDLH